MHSLSLWDSDVIKGKMPIDIVKGICFFPTQQNSHSVPTNLKGILEKSRMQATLSLALWGCFVQLGFCVFWHQKKTIKHYFLVLLWKCFWERWAFDSVDWVIRSTLTNTMGIILYSKDSYQIERWKKSKFYLFLSS